MHPAGSQGSAAGRDLLSGQVLFLLSLHSVFIANALTPEVLTVQFGGEYWEPRYDAYLAGHSNSIRVKHVLFYSFTNLSRTLESPPAWHQGG